MATAATASIGTALSSATTRRRTRTGAPLRRSRLNGRRRSVSPPITLTARLHPPSARLAMMTTLASCSQAAHRVGEVRLEVAGHVRRHPEGWQGDLQHGADALDGGGGAVRVDDHRHHRQPLEVVERTDAARQTLVDDADSWQRMRPVGYLDDARRPRRTGRTRSGGRRRRSRRPRWRCSVRASADRGRGTHAGDRVQLGEERVGHRRSHPQSKLVRHRVPPRSSRPAPDPGWRRSW